mmetsp:Transcript_64879/g.200949  ORF Transcript_64879/g.200949 Transcript_64879/m.200949 type:complete len:206 (-) Transcript_64879:567-1184(-)
MTTALHGVFACDRATSSRCSRHVSVGASAARGSRTTSGPRRSTRAALGARPPSARGTRSPSSRATPKIRAPKRRLRTPCRTPPPSRSPCGGCPSVRTASGCSRWRTTACRTSPRSPSPSTSTASPSCTRKRSGPSRFRPSRSSARAAFTTTSGVSTCPASSASRSRSSPRARFSTLPWAAGRPKRSSRRRRGSAGPRTSPARCSW